MTTIMKHQVFLRIDDFVEDLNYQKILLNIKYVNKEQLKARLEQDDLNKIYRLENAKFMYIVNCDFNGEEIETEKDLLDFVTDEKYIIYDLFYNDVDGYFIVSPADESENHIEKYIEWLKLQYNITGYQEALVRGFLTNRPNHSNLYMFYGKRGRT